MMWFGHFKTDLRQRESILCRGDRGAEDIDVLFAEPTRDIREQTRAVQRFHLDIDKEHRGLRRRPLDIDDSVVL